MKNEERAVLAVAFILAVLCSIFSCHLLTKGPERTIERRAESSGAISAASSPAPRFFSNADAAPSAGTVSILICAGPMLTVYVTEADAANVVGYSIQDADAHLFRVGPGVYLFRVNRYGVCCE